MLRLHNVPRPPPSHSSETRHVHCPLTALTIALVGLIALACIDPENSPPSQRPTATVAPVEPTAAPTLPPPPPTPLPTPTQMPELRPNDAIVVGGDLRAREAPSSRSRQVGTLSDGQRLKIVGRVQGENWLVGSQTWVGAAPAWASEWFALEDGSYVYGAFVFILFEGEVSPLSEVPARQERWIDVSLSRQVARAMVGEEVVFTAPVTTGAPPFETPTGTFAIEEDGRIAVERMTASQAGYDPEQAQYDVERVLFTQYFDRSGDALHLNYWRPHFVFGRTPTSHGCVGLELHEAQYLWLFAGPGTRVEIHD